MMQFLSCLRGGFRIAARHKRLILVLWAAPLLPAVVLAAMAAANLGPALGPSLFADGVLDGGWFVVWSEFRSSPLDALEPILGAGVAVMVLLSLALQVVLSAGVVEVLIERRDRHPFVMGVRSNFLRFARTTLLLAVGTALAAAAASVVVRGFFKVAEAQADGRLDLVGVASAGLVFLALWLPQRVAADLSRIAAARHDQRSMTRGYLRALAAVLRRPGLFAPLTASFVLLPVALHLGYFLLRSPWTPASAAAIALLLVAQQVVMVLRAVLRLGFWGAEVAAFQRLGEPQLSRPRPEREKAQRAAIVEPVPADSYTI
jgi:hypothetical protein